MTDEELRVVFDLHTLVEGQVYPSSTWDFWPHVPPVTGNPSADCLGIVFNRPAWTLWVSTRQLEWVTDLLHGDLGVPVGQSRAFVRGITATTVASGGGVVTTSGAGPFGTGVGANLREAGRLAEHVFADAVVLHTPTNPLVSGAWQAPWGAVWVSDPATFCANAPSLG
ncbi:hypothetical protein BH20ACT9_BH20ACT9_17140 [soil metagenome]